MRLVVKTLQGQTFSIKVKLADSIDKLKEKIYREDARWSPDSSRLVFAGQCLEDDCSIADCRIPHGSTVFLLSSSTGRIKMSAKTSTGRVVAVEVEPCDSVEIIKKKIQDAAGKSNRSRSP
jgi:ubiquitin C